MLPKLKFQPSYIRTYRYFIVVFPEKNIIECSIKKSWITAGIKISRDVDGRLGEDRRRGEGNFYLQTKSNSDIKMRQYNELYGKLVNELIIEAKRCNYNKRISALQNTIKTRADIIKYETGQRNERAKINNSETDCETFNNHFLRSVENISDNVSNK